MIVPAVTIVIPAKNEGDRIGKCLEAIHNQETTYPIEIVVIDSGSTDNTPDIVRQYPDVRLKEIPAQEFGHGKTRNLGAEMASGDVMVFLNADAVPVGNNWLAPLVHRLMEDDTIAGVFSRQLPNSDCYLYMARDLLASMPPTPSLRTRTHALEYMIFSTVSCAIPRKIREQFPFDDHILIAEDQQWGKKVLEAGYKIAYEPASRVYHSHNYTPGELYRIKRNVGASTGRFKNRFNAIVAGFFLVTGGVLVKLAGDFRYIFFKRHPNHSFTRKLKEFKIAFKARISSLWGRYAGWVEKKKDGKD
ncbi:MAG: glycosyltransferase family 2 protein [bacterium]|nr:glycosyltransferase family 2 protein [bacterium]